MERIFVVVTPICPHYAGRKVGSKECTQCDHFRGGIVQNFVDCVRNRVESVPKCDKSVPKRAKSVPATTKKKRIATKAKNKRNKTRSNKKV